MNTQLVVTNWQRAYQEGKYEQEAPIEFVKDIVDAVTKNGFKNKLGFYPGCGNGRNFIPLVNAGLTIEGSDVSNIALNQLRTRCPSAQVTTENFLTRPDQTYAYLLAIQLFQHGNTEEVKKYFEKTLRQLRPGALFALRVNSIHTQVVETYDLVEKSTTGGFTVKYTSGQKIGQDVHFYTAEEIHELTYKYYDVYLPLREEFIVRKDGTYWAQWETILKKKG